MKGLAYCSLILQPLDSPLNCQNAHAKYLSPDLRSKVQSSGLIGTKEQLLYSLI